MILKICSATWESVIRPMKTSKRVFVCLRQYNQARDEREGQSRNSVGKVRENRIVKNESEHRYHRQKIHVMHEINGTENGFATFYIH